MWVFVIVAFVFYSDLFVCLFLTILSGIPGVLLVLLSGIAPGRVWMTIWGIGD